VVNNFDANYSRIGGKGDYYKLVMWSPLNPPRGTLIMFCWVNHECTNFYYRGGLIILRLRGGYTMLFIAPLSRGRGVGGEVSLTTNARIFITAEKGENAEATRRCFATKAPRHKVPLRMSFNSIVDFYFAKGHSIFIHERMIILFPKYHFYILHWIFYIFTGTKFPESVSLKARKGAKAIRLCNFPLWGIEGADIFLFLIFTFLLFIPKRLIINYE